jgi:hypothetical protein
MKFKNGSSINWSDSLYGLPYYESLGEFTWLGIERHSMYGEGLGGAQMERTTGDYDRPAGQISIKKEVELQISHLEKQLAVQQELKKLLDENPVIERFMNLSRGIL